MRIPQEQLSYFKELCFEVAPQSKVYLFNSRLDDISEYLSDVIESTKTLLEVIEFLVIKIKEKIN